MQKREELEKQRGELPEALLKNRQTISKLASSGEAKQLIGMLQRQGEVQAAARQAAQGDATQLVEMMNRLMESREGAQLVERITQQAKQSGLG